MVHEPFDGVPDDPDADRPDERAPDRRWVSRSDGAEAGSQAAAETDRPAGVDGADRAVSDLPTVTRSIELDAAIERVWDAVADPDRRALWLDDEDAAGRVWRMDEVDHGRSLAWTWWNPDDAEGASRVEIELTELATGGTRVVVTEQPVVPSAGASLRAQASTAAAAWDRRLLGLELLFVLAGAWVGAGAYVG